MEKIEEVVTNVVSSSDADVFHPLLLKRDVEKVAYVLITSDRGLAGAYNSSILKQFAADCLMDECEAAVYAIGKKAYSFAKNKNYNLVNEEMIQNKDEVTFQNIKVMAHNLVKMYQNGEADKIVIYYSHYVNTLTQEVKVKTLLPIETNESKSGNLYDFEGGAQTIIDNVLPLYIENIIYGIILDAKASEHASRMTAMQSATDNALEIIDTLQLYYNRARQASITLELTDIIGGANAVE
jgi:F-type H+-transporting ATPase subunit gamma